MDAPTPAMSRAQRAALARAKNNRRRARVSALAEQHDGVVTRSMVLGAGITRGELQVELERGVWQRAGVHTLSISTPEPQGRGLLWRALWESGTRSVLDGATALVAGGLKHWTSEVIDVSVPNNARVRETPGVRHHRLRRIGPTTGGDLRRTRPEVAVVRAARWARTPRQAATILAMTVQQRLATPEAVLAEWALVRSTAGRALLDAFIQDVCNGAHSLNELDFARLCRDRGLPEPTRQAVRAGENGRVYLDALWEGLGVHVEIQGAHHLVGTAGIEDALRSNHLALSHRGLVSLQIPVLGLRLTPDRFLDQVARALADAATTAA